MAENVRTPRGSGLVEALKAAAIALGVLATAVALTLIVVSTFKLQGIAETNRRNGERVIDCTTPGGDCFNESTARTGEAVGSINEVTVAAVACAQKNTGIAAIQECVRKALAK